MRATARLTAFVLIGFLLSLSVLRAEDKDKKAPPKQDEAKKIDGKKDEPAKKDADKPKEKPAEKMIKVGVVGGKVMGVVEAKKSLRVQLTVAKDKTVDVEWQATDDVKVRVLNPPPQFDDKGRIKRYTAKELKELKGDDKKTPGYPAEFSDLKQGQYVQVTLVKKKGGPVRGGKDTDAGVTGEYAPHMSMIVIVAEPKN